MMVLMVCPASLKVRVHPCRGGTYKPLPPQSMDCGLVDLRVGARSGSCASGI